MRLTMADQLPLDVNELAVRSMNTDQLARLRVALLAAQSVVEAALHEDMRAMRAGGATLQEIVAASGYRSIDGVRKILDPEVKGKAAAARQRKNASRATVAAGRVILTEDAVDASALAGWGGGKA